MPLYRYKALNAHGEMLDGQMEAASDAEADDLIAGMAFASDDEYSDDSENESSSGNPDGIQKPPRVRVRQRRIKRAEDQESQEPETAAASEN